MLDLWRPPVNAGEPVGCLATTYTFTPELFEEQCLARFLGIDSEPSKETLAFLLEREERLGGVYAGVLVDRAQSGVEHSLRWDVLPVAVPGGKQHAKLSLLVWAHHVRLIVASANVTDAGYRINQEVAVGLDFTEASSDRALLDDALAILDRLLGLVPGAADSPPEIARARTFLFQVRRRTVDWKRAKPGGLRRHLTVTLPTQGEQPAQSALETALAKCHIGGDAPNRVSIASPFFGSDSDAEAVVKVLIRGMAKLRVPSVTFCVPETSPPGTARRPRLAAPKALIEATDHQNGLPEVFILPQEDGKNARPWHAKMLELRGRRFSALMVGSSNFTCAGMGVGGSRNAEVNLLTIVASGTSQHDMHRIRAIWPDMTQVTDPDRAEWLSATAVQDEDESNAPVLPAGFLPALFRAGGKRVILLRFVPDRLPDNWRISTAGPDRQELLSSDSWRNQGQPNAIEIDWNHPRSPGKLVVEWEGMEAFLPINVEDQSQVPPIPELAGMTADEMLAILAALNPAAAIRAWANRQKGEEPFDPDLDSATNADLDPLRRYDLQTTFLHRIRRRARQFADARFRLERPAYSHASLQWRLTGALGIEGLAQRMASELEKADGDVDEALLSLADLLIVLREVQYQPDEQSLSGHEFERVFRPFLRGLSSELGQRVAVHQSRFSPDVLAFWEQVISRCQR